MHSFSFDIFNYLLVAALLAVVSAAIWVAYLSRSRKKDERQPLGIPLSIFLFLLIAFFIYLVISYSLIFFVYK